MTNRKKRTKRKKKRVDIHHSHRIDPEMPDIAGENVQLKLKEQNLPPFFRSLLDADRPLPNYVKFIRHGEPEMGETILLLALAFLFCFLPAVALIIHFVTKQMYEVFPLVVLGLFLSAFGFALYLFVKAYRDVKAFQRDKGRYGIFLCRYALFVRYYSDWKECQLFPKHTLVDVEYREGITHTDGSQSFRYGVTLYYNNAQGKKMSRVLLNELGSYPAIESILRDWLDTPLDVLS